MIEDSRFNQDKLTDLSPFRKRSVLHVGGGAVGSYGADFTAKEGVGRQAINDYDHYEMDNASKTCSVVRFPEDDGRWKAEALAERTGAEMINGSAWNAIVGSVELLGPLAFAAFDYVCTAPDNKAVREYVNQQLKQIPAESRPVLIVGGTDGEMATSAVFTDLNQACYRCTCEESSFRHAKKKTSCADAQYHFTEDGTAERIIVSNLSSAKAGILMADDLRAHAAGKLHGSRVRVWNPDNPIAIMSYPPRRRDDCPDCQKLSPPEEIHMLDGSVLDTDLQEVLSQVERFLGTDDFELSIHRHCFGEETYAAFVLKDYCRACGQPIEVYRHTGRGITEADLKCAACRAKNTPIDDRIPSGIVEEIYGFAPSEDRERLLNMRMFDLGYPIGAYLMVTAFNGAVDRCDPRVKEYCFTMRGDREEIMKNHNFMEGSTNADA